MKKERQERKLSQKMKRILAVLALLGTCSLVAPAQTPSKKSSVPGSRDGTYVGGQGSSHKGGTYQNPKTGNEERNRKAGVPPTPTKKK